VILSIGFGDTGSQLAWLLVAGLQLPLPRELHPCYHSSGSDSDSVLQFAPVEVGVTIHKILRSRKSCYLNGAIQSKVTWCPSTDAC